MRQWRGKEEEPARGRRKYVNDDNDYKYLPPCCHKREMALTKQCDLLQYGWELGRPLTRMLGNRGAKNVCREGEEDAAVHYRLVLEDNAMLMGNDKMLELLRQRDEEERGGDKWGGSLAQQ